jgi:hypothetical protein
MADIPDQRNELDDFLVVLRKVQRPEPDRNTIKRAEAAARLLHIRMRKGKVMDPHRWICAEIDKRLADLKQGA